MKYFIIVFIPAFLALVLSTGCWILHSNENNWADK